MTLHYDIAEVLPYVNWIYFYHAWQLKDETQQGHIRQEAEVFLQAHGSRYRTHAVCLLTDAYSDGDDIVLTRGARCEVRGAGNEDGEMRIPCLRQQQAGSDYLCLADFISPRFPVGRSTAATTQIALFATSVDKGMETDFDADPYQKMMAQLLADRLAEATAERLHEQVRKELWGYAKDEQLTIAEMLQERFQGIRPAVGYPSLPDASINFLLDELLQMQQIGITLTESGAMRPHASVSGLMLSHPQARYFSVGKVGEDQLADYARRRDLPLSTIRKFLAANL